MNGNESETIQHKQGWIKRNSLKLYYVLAISFTSAIWLPTSIIAATNKYILPDPFTFVELIQYGFTDTTHVILSIIFSIGVYGPLFSAMLMTYKEQGRVGLRDLVKRITKWHVDVKWYLAILILPFVITIPAVLIGLLIGLPLPSPLELAIPFQLLIPFILWQLFTSGLEEPGWRGYALPKLQRKHSAEAASWRLGVYWSVWHWPYLAFIYASTAVLDGVSPEMVPVAIGVTIVQSLFLHAISTAGISVVYTWLYNNTKSVFICILFHTATNVANVYVQTILPHVALSVVLGIMPWIVALILLRRYGKETLTGARADLGYPSSSRHT